MNVSLVRTIAIVAALGMATAAPAAAPASEHPSQVREARLDPGFGAHGRVIGETFTKGYDYPTRAALYPNGSIATLFGETVSRYLPDGRLDPSFGEGGKAALPNFEAARELLRPAAIAVDAEGRVLVAATRLTAEYATLPGNPRLRYFGQPRYLATVIRYLPNGELDPSFGEDGIANSDLGLPPGFNAENPTEAFPFPTPQVRSMALDPRGRIVLAGTYTTAVYPYCKYMPIPTSGAFVARLARNGGLDTSFAGTGSVTVSDLIYEDATVATTAGGGAILGTEHPQDFGCGFPLPEDKSYQRGSLMRSSALGRVDRQFSGNGVLHTSHPVVQVAVDGSGRVLALTAPGAPRLPDAAPTAEVLRLQPNGSPDRSFGTKGRASLAGAFNAIAPGGRGTVLLAGGAGSPETGPSRFLLMRLTHTGRPDRSFAPGGRVKTAFGEERAIANSVLVDRRGRLVLAGTLADPTALGGFPTVALARYLVPR